ncbi:phosphoribosylformylglycinamidine synthase subunit PurQ [Mobiluncus porci]|nr:phosphoribosylformylglycinamidine synthase subunit PurQ [Mobiluncus porci]
MDARLAIRRKPQFRDAEKALLTTLNHLEGVSLESVDILHLYDVFEAHADDLAALTEKVVQDRRVDDFVSAEFVGNSKPTVDPTGAYHLLAVEPLPGQYDQRADAAEQALRLLNPSTTASIISAELYVLRPAPTADALEAIRGYLINPVESREKNLAILQAPQIGTAAPLREYPDFLTYDETRLQGLLQERGMAMNLADLKLIQDYFRSEGRVPTEVELAVLDTYWSDHCRHTTFNTELTDIEIAEPRYGERLEAALARWDELRALNGRTAKPHTLMDLGTIMGRELRRTGVLDDQEVSEEINACSVRVNVSKGYTSATPLGSDPSGYVAGATTPERSDPQSTPPTEPWLLMFKNETHNHPTEIEPFGGAATCLGGAIRDPLSGRSWVYQALRLSGAGDINTPRAETLPGKLPQADISSRATRGYSSYGNQIGLATTGVREIVHPGYVAKRMELGAVVAAASEANVHRLEPQAGDVVILLGGRTGRDGIGGATGSSKAHNKESLAHSGAEVQKGNPVNERKIQRLFRNPEVAQMIVRCNDFGAGGVAVAVGELAESLDIHLERVPLKYAGLNAREIAISESQERMAVVVRAKDAPRFHALAETENLEATQLAEVTDTGRLRMFLGEELVLDLKRSFVDTNGAPRTQKVKMVPPALGEGEEGAATSVTASANTSAKPYRSVLETLAEARSGSQEGMVEQFDSTVGRSTVLMPYGGKLQKTDETASIQTLPMEGGTCSASIITYGYSPTLADRSPFLMGAYSVVEALSKLVAAGARAEDAWLTVQEYFQRPDEDPEVWGVVLQALLGLLEAQDAFQVAAIGGKDSMSGSFGDKLHVPPTLVSFTVGLMDASEAISAALPSAGATEGAEDASSEASDNSVPSEAGPAAGAPDTSATGEPSDLYYLPHVPHADGTPDYASLRANFQAFHELAASGAVLAASPVLPGGLGATVVNMALGNAVGFKVAPEAVRAYLRPGSEAAQLAAAPLGGIVFAVARGTDLGSHFAVGGDFDFTKGRQGTSGEPPENPQVIAIGATSVAPRFELGFESFELSEALAVMERGYASVYPLNESESEPLPDFALGLAESETKAGSHATETPNSGPAEKARPEGATLPTNRQTGASTAAQTGVPTSATEGEVPSTTNPANVSVGSDRSSMVALKPPTSPGTPNSAATGTPTSASAATLAALVGSGAAADAPHVLLPVFPGTNSEYDMDEAFRAAGATTEFLVLRNLTPQMLAADTEKFIARLAAPETRILAFSGGFSLGDEPDGSAKFMAAFLKSEKVAAAVKKFTSENGLVLGVCNGFQALVKSGFLPYGDPALQTAESPTLAHNRQLRHVSRIATTRVASVASPWLGDFELGQFHRVPVSHGEGRFVVSEAEARSLFDAGQVAFQYVDAEGAPTMSAPDNPNGSSFAIEGIISPDGKILGKMGHPERYRPGLMKNIPEIGVQDIFANAVRWCKTHEA